MHVGKVGRGKGEKGGRIHRAQLVDALLELVVLVLEFLLLAQPLALLERLVLAVPFLVCGVRGVDRLLHARTQDCAQRDGTCMCRAEYMYWSYIGHMNGDRQKGVSACNKYK